MICAIHQPQYLPYLGYFHKMALCDIFIILDDVQYKKNEWQNRNRIKTSQGAQYITLPVNYKFSQKICEVGINSSSNWQKKHLTTLEINYGKADNFSWFFDHFTKLIAEPWPNLATLNTAIIKNIVELIGISCRIQLSSELNIKGSSTERLVNICKAVGATSYLSGVGGKDYLDKETFIENKIELQFQDYTSSPYSQLSFKNFSEFIPNLSIVDLLFNCGKESLKILKG